jgi:DNA-3-methyladenine glycosylase
MKSNSDHSHRLTTDFFNRDTLIVAKEMLGKQLVYATPTQIISSIITETEAYTQEDSASHSYQGKISKRNEAMFAAPGSIYIYLIYGMHYCLNFVTEETGRGCAVLIRTVMPQQGLEYMQEQRNHCKQAQLCNGPAKLVQAYGLDSKLNNTLAVNSALYLADSNVKLDQIEELPRIGISKNTQELWRFKTSIPTS